MSPVVVDASVALAWCFADEGSDYADQVLVALEGHEVTVPAIWGLEIANAVLVGERGKRLKQPDIQQFLTLLNALAIRQDVSDVRDTVSSILPLARRHRLSAYDAAYLELAVRCGAPLATLDPRLKKAAIQAGIPIFFLIGESRDQPRRELLAQARYSRAISST